MFWLIQRRRNIIRRRKLVTALLLVVEKRKIFTVVIAIAVQNVETHSAIRFIQIVLVYANFFDYLKEMHIVQVGNFMRSFKQGCQRNHMHSLFPLSIKTFCSKIPRTKF